MKKLSLLLASIGAGLLLVGGTVAAYIVTAAPNKGVRVTPGTLVNDDTGHITLNWGANTIADVEGLIPGSESDIGNVVLTATSGDVTEVASYQGKFTVSLQNTSEVGSGVNLLNYLKVRAYDGETKKIEVDGTALERTGFTNTIAKTYRTTVELDFSAQALSEADYTAISGQTVYVEFSWGPKDGDEQSENIGTLYFVNKNNYTTPYFFAQNGAKRNAQYPGVAMTKAYKTKIDATEYDVYTVEFDTTKYNTFIFTDFADQTKKYEVSEVTSTEGANIKNGTKPTIVCGTRTFADKPTKELAAYYLRGKFGTDLAWGTSEAELTDNYALHVTTGDPFIQKHLVVGDEFKIYVPADAGDKWYAPSGENYVITNDLGAGDYTIAFDDEYHEGWVDCGSGYYIYVNNDTTNPPA